MPSSISRNLRKSIFEFMTGISEIILFIHFYPHGYHMDRAWDTFWKKITKWRFHSTSNEIQISSTGKKVPFWQFFRLGWDGRECPVRLALKNPSQCDITSVLQMCRLVLFWAGNQINLQNLTDFHWLKQKNSQFWSF